MFKHVHLVELDNLHYVIALPVMNGSAIVEEYDSLDEALERGKECEPYLEKRWKLQYNVIKRTRLS